MRVARASVSLALAALLAAAALAVLTTAAAADAAPAPSLNQAAYQFERGDASYPSRSLRHLEPVLHYRVMHEDNMQLHSTDAHDPASTHAHKLNAANSVGAHSLKLRSRHGHRQPFPDQVSVKFRAFGIDWNFPNMQLDVHTWAADTVAIVKDASGRETKGAHALDTYRSVFNAMPTEGAAADADAAGTQGWAVITLAEDGLMTAVIHAQGETYQINPMFVHAHELPEEEPATLLLQKSAVHNMVMFRQSDAKHRGLDPVTKEPLTTCGAVVDPNDPQAANTTKVLHEDAHLEGVASARRLLAYPPGYGITLWTNCYPNDQSAHKIATGVAVDAGYYSIYATNNNVLNSIANVYAAVNAVYLAQFNVYIEIGAVVVRTAADSDTWNMVSKTDGSRCPETTADFDINDQLASFRTWRTTVKKDLYALWHLFTNCWPAPGTVGLANLRAVCSKTSGVGVSSWTSNFWTIVAHEIGHNFGGQHAFQEGQGTTGGLMDYGDGQYPVGSGVYQFHPVYNKPEICAHLSSASTTTGISPYCWADYAPVCGNGVVEKGEQCDDTSACCSQCQLVGQCTPGSGSSLNPCCSSTCAYTSTKISCNNGLGYCGNGQCIDAVCSGYGLDYCGLSADGCSQQCTVRPPKTRACSTGWSTPDVRLATGLICDTNPATFSTCSAGKCVASTPTATYKWVTGAATACTCSGVSTVTVTCQKTEGTSVTTVADSFCSGAGAKPSTSGTCTPPSSCYSWATGAFTTCSVDCGTGVQTRVVNCVLTSSGAVVSASQCTTAKPVTTQSCTPGTCPTEWALGNWGLCTTDCGGGVQVRSVQCQQTQNGAKSNVGPSFCPQPVPISSQPCNTPACTNGQWVYSTWTTCTKTCGGGTQTRTVKCVNPADGTAYPDNSRCVGTPAALTQSCSTAPCPVYQWSSTAWGACSVSQCGGGTQTRQTSCYDTANDPNKLSPTNNNFCTNTMPPTVQACNTPACPPPPNYVWLPGTWQTCSASCGSGTQIRSVTCVNSNAANAPAADSSCTAVKPATTQICSQQGCPVYVWVASSFSSCTVSCGGGTQTRTVSCRDQATNGVVANSQCANAGAAPPTSQACNTASCPPPAPTVPPHTWVQGAGSACSAACNGGTQTFAPKCYRTDVTPNTLLEDSVCADLVRPPTQGPCNTQRCPTYWATGAFSACSAACGPSGLQTRTVACYLTSDNIATATPQPDTACTGSKPSTQASCNSHPCPSWQYSSEFGACSEPCGQGIRTRNVACQNYDGTAAPDSACIGQVAPPVSELCEVMPCPHWHRDAWSECTKPCADALGPGTQNRTVVCRFPHDDPRYNGIECKDVSLCEQNGDGDDGEGASGLANQKPPVVQTCATEACPSYYWQQSNPSECSASCGGGIRTYTVVCVDASSGLPADKDSLCVSEKPPSQAPCMEHECPEYRWHSGNWTDCSSFCAAGNQTSLVTCRNLKPGPSMHYAFIDVDPSFCAQSASAGPMPAATRACSPPADTCWGNVVGVRNGRCDAETDKCVCRSGISGATCEQTAQIVDVQTSGDEFGPSGVPLQQPLSISWRSDPMALPRVSILLRRRNAASTWPVPQYLAAGILNTNAWSWNVGSILEAGLEAGDSYSILVWASQHAYNESATFVLADPCAYTSCGDHGVCANGLCQCSAGFSGPSCGMGPCEAARCDPQHSSCNNTRVVTTGQFLSANVCALNASSTTCLAGYTGAQCRTPPACANLQCLNGGDIANAVQANGTCTGACDCRGNWIGEQCQTCGLHCRHGGSPNSGCTACAGCGAGYFGQTCECKFYSLGFRFYQDVSGWFNPASSGASPSLAQQRWTKTLAQDVLLAVSTVSNVRVDVSVDTIKQLAATRNSQAQVVVTLRLSLDCSTVGSFGGDDGADAPWSYMDYSPARGPSDELLALFTHERLALPYPRSQAGAFGRRLLQTAADETSDATLLATYNALLPLLQDRNSIVFQGQITSTMDPTWAVTAADPSGEQTLVTPLTPQDCFVDACDGSGGGGGPTDPSSSESKSFIDKLMDSTLYSALAIVALVLIAALMVVGGVLLYRRHNAKRDTTAALSRLGSTGLESEMTANPALASITNAGRWNNISV